MLFSSNFFETLVNLTFYIFIYNFSLILLFWVLMQFINIQNKTLYSFAKLKFNFFALFTVTILFLSMAGVPPFIGFFVKLLILISLLNTGFTHLFVTFFILLFFSLYFYIQNIRFLYSATLTKINYAFVPTLRTPLYYIYLIYTVIFFVIFGFFFFDDFLLYFVWLFS